MTRLLLDHPWPLDQALCARSEAFKVLLEFKELVRKSGLAPVRFVQQIEFDNAKLALGKSHAAAQILQFSYNLIRHEGNVIPATPEPEPIPPLSDFWKSALNDELGDMEDWRNPQIVVPEKRRAVWPNTAEVSIQSEDHPGTPPQDRVLVTLERYESHSFAVSDIDPWRHLEWLYPPEQGVANKNPCRLPRPPILNGVPLEELFEMLVNARRDSWKVNGNYYFIPSADWRPDQIAKPEWRSGYAFTREKVPGWKGPCPIDYKGQTWRWDRGERHWDVQVKPRIRVRYDGLEL